MRTVIVVHYTDNSVNSTQFHEIFRIASQSRLTTSKSRGRGTKGEHRFRLPHAFLPHGVDIVQRPRERLRGVQHAEYRAKNCRGPLVQTKETPKQARTQESAEHKVRPGRALVQKHGRSQRYDEVAYPTRCQSERGRGCSRFQWLHLCCEDLSGYPDQCCPEGGGFKGLYSPSRQSPMLRRICEGSIR